MNLRSAVLAPVVLLAIAACDSTEPESAPTVVPSEPTVSTPETDTQPPDEPAEETPTETAQADGGVSSFAFEDPATFSENGVELSITEMDIAAPDATAVAEIVQYSEVQNPTAVLAITIEVSNDSGDAVEFFPEYGTVHIGREQVDSDILMSEVVGGEIRDGVDTMGAAVFVLSATEYEAAIDAGELTYITDAALDPVSYDTVTSDVELSVTW